MRIAKWGNSLAVRLPADLVKALELKEGDEVEIRAGLGRVLELSHDLAHLRALDARLNAVEEMRKLAVPLPPGYKFNREEAHERGVRESEPVAKQ